MKFVLASKNPHKITELQAILGDLGVEVVLESDVGVDLEVEETGETFEENAALKAVAVMKASGLPAIADDSGLCVDALMWTAMSWCSLVCGASWTAGLNLSAPSAVPFPTEMCSPLGASAPALLPTPPREITALAMTRCFLCPSCGKPMLR